MSFQRIALVLLLTMSAPVLAARAFSFAPLPMEQPETVVKQVRPMLAFLEKHIAADLRIEYSSDYADILKKFQEGTLDFAYLGPLPYVALREKYAQAVPVVHFIEKSGKASYTCAIVTAGGNVSLAGLKGKKIALTQPLSTCGYLSTDGMLRKAGLDLEQTRYRYLDKHDEVALAVARGEFDAGGLKTSIGRKYAHLGLSIVAETAALPGFALIANGRTVDAGTIAAVQKALVGLKPLLLKDDAELTQNWGENIKRGAEPAKDSDYDAVRKLRGRADIPEEGNF